MFRSPSRLHAPPVRGPQPCAAARPGPPQSPSYIGQQPGPSNGGLTPQLPEESPPQWRVSDEAVRAAFSSVRAPEARRTEAEVHGEVPRWLSGSYLRNGPGDFEGMRHLFDGYAMVFKVEFDRGRCFCTHRFIETEAWKSKRDTGRMRWREFGTAIPADSPLEKAAEYLTTILGSLGLTQGVTDNASVNVVPWGDGTALAMTETVAGTYTLDSASLDTTSKVTYDDALLGQLTTAHPQPDGSGGMINVASDPVMGFTLYRIPLGGNSREVIAHIPHRRALSPCWVHSIAVSENWAVVPEYPAFFNLLGLMTDRHVKQGAYFVEWRPALRTLYHAVHLQSGEVKTFRAPAAFAFHFVNAHESPDGNTLYVDVAEFEDLEVVDRLSIAGPSLDTSRGIPPARLLRVELPLNGPPTSDDDIIDIHAGRNLVPEPEESLGAFFEFPAINPAWRRRRQRYVYGVCAVQPTRFGNALARVDCSSGGVVVWHEEGAIPGEPCFVARPGATEEDDGVVLSVLTEADGGAAVLVLDARTMQEVARCRLPHQIPYGFHGGWFGAGGGDGDAGTNGSKPGS
ncbi:unnamed protein product [Pedinophyceae sp. YPF-701]|nr:unnamed protein product [Pedinophyceae sp. YPF-701]